MGSENDSFVAPSAFESTLSGAKAAYRSLNDADDKTDGCAKIDTETTPNF